jgi:hypothetical protein
MRTHTAVMILLSAAVLAWCGMADTKALDAGSPVSPSELIAMASDALADGNKPMAIHCIDRYLAVADDDAVAAEMAEFWKTRSEQVRADRLLLAERVAALYETPAALKLAGIAYYKALGVPKDYARAMDYFSHPSLTSLPDIMLYKAAILLDPSFQDRRSKKTIAASPGGG